MASARHWLRTPPPRRAQGRQAGLLQEERGFRYLECLISASGCQDSFGTPLASWGHLPDCGSYFLKYKMGIKLEHKSTGLSETLKTMGLKHRSFSFRPEQLEPSCLPSSACGTGAPAEKGRHSAVCPRKGAVTPKQWPLHAHSAAHVHTVPRAAPVSPCCPQPDQELSPAVSPAGQLRHEVSTCFSQSAAAGPGPVVASTSARHPLSPHLPAAPGLQGERGGCQRRRQPELGKGRGWQGGAASEGRQAAQQPQSRRCGRSLGSGSAPRSARRASWRLAEGHGPCSELFLARTLPGLQRLRPSSLPFVRPRLSEVLLPGLPWRGHSGTAPTRLPPVPRRPPALPSPGLLAQ